MKRHGVLIWCPGRNETLKHSPAYIIKDAESWWYLTKHRLSRTLSGKLPKVLSPTPTPKFSGVCSVTRPGIPEGSVNAFLVSAILRNGRRSRLIVVKSPLPIRSKSNRGLTHMGKIPTSYGYVSVGYSLEQVRWNSSPVKMSKRQRPLKPRPSLQIL